MARLVAGFEILQVKRGDDSELNELLAVRVTSKFDIAPLKALGQNFSHFKALKMLISFI